MTGTRKETVLFRGEAFKKKLLFFSLFLFLRAPTPRALNIRALRRDEYELASAAKRVEFVIFIPIYPTH